MNLIQLEAVKSSSLYLIRQRGTIVGTLNLKTGETTLFVACVLSYKDLTSIQEAIDMAYCQMLDDTVITESENVSSDETY